MYVRKIGVAASFAAGAAFALAPLASADPVEITSTVSGEIASLNSLFDFEATLAGVGAHVIPASAANPFDTIPLADAPQVAPLTTLDYELYGVNPLAAGPASDPGSYELFNGALGKFDDAYNVLLYSALNNGAIDPNDADFIGSASSIDHAQGLASATEAAQYFFNFGVGDLEGYLGIFPTAAASTADSVDVTSLLSSEAGTLNSLFEGQALFSGVDPTDIIHGSGGPVVFDTIDPANSNDIFNTVLFGFNPDNVSPDPGSYDVFNGALTEFANAFNVEYYSLLSGGDLIPVADIFGTHADFLAGGATSAISDFLQLGVSDLAGYFDFSSLLGSM